MLAELGRLWILNRINNSISPLLLMSCPLSYMGKRLQIPDIDFFMKKRDTETQFAVCIKNEDYPASLELQKIYQVIKDPDAATHQQIRVIDESGEDYLYPDNYFVLIKIPKAVESTFSH